MKYFLISDNMDTITGLRLVGIEGVLAKTKEEAEKALSTAVNDKDVAIIIITEKLKKLCVDSVSNILFHRASPLIVEIPDRHGFGRDRDSLSSFISEAIGLKL
ncbi:MAG: V-type ATP synthase subunit F [Bacillota bacterium]|nr:V-type ATP synthase subunit F [Bacillota bacterium]